MVVQAEDKAEVRHPSTLLLQAESVQYHAHGG